MCPYFKYYLHTMFGNNQKKYFQKIYIYSLSGFENQRMLQERPSNTKIKRKLTSRMKLDDHLFI